jgi:diguanylate cyclase (GGDEF)-like protein
LSDDFATLNPPTKEMKPGPSIRLRLLILAIAAIVPLALERVYDIETDRRADTEDARQHTLVLTQQGAEKQNQSIAAARATLRLISRAYPQFTASKAPCDELLKAILGGTPGVKTISVAGADGKIACSANPRSVGLDISGRPHFRQVMKNGGFAVSEYALGTVIEGPTVVVSYGEKTASGSVETVFMALLDLDWIGRVAAGIAQRSGSVALIVDRTGTVLTRHPNPDDWMGRQYKNHPLIEKMIAQTEGVVTENDIDGVRRIFGFTRLPGTNAHFAIGLDEAQVLERVNASMIRNYSQFTILTVLVLTAIWFGAQRFFMRPIHKLARTATQIGQGQNTARAMYKTLAAEFHPLAAAMDDMADQLAAREDELRTTNGELERLAQRDDLTGLANRRAFDAQLSAAWRMSTATAEPVALLMIDVDHFKQFNDNYGHLEGDACLRAVANALEAGVRKDGAFVSRFGGEEFVVLVPDATVDEAVKLAERLRAAVEKIEIAVLRARHVTISIGVASLVAAGSDGATSLIEAADDALYAAKQHGRNRVVAFTPIALSKTA